MRHLSPILLSSIISLVACGGRSTLDTSATSDVGAVATGGAYSTGGLNRPSGGNNAGGAIASGGDLATGGRAVTGGTLATGGVPCCDIEYGCAAGEMQLSGPDMCPTGQQCYSHDNCCGCCSPTWCAIATGGAGGAASTGGTSSIGGTSATGGVPTSGGTTDSIGGAPGIGGLTSKGRVQPTGGASTTGGTATDAGTEDAGGAATIDGSTGLTLVQACSSICAFASGLATCATTPSVCAENCESTSSLTEYPSEYQAMVICTAENLLSAARYACSSAGSSNAWSPVAGTLCENQTCRWTCDDASFGDAYVFSRCGDEGFAGCT